jgi:hypothetical protein
LSDHRDLKAALQDTYDEAKRLRDEAQTTIDTAATNRANDAAIKELEERNKAFYDLEGQMHSETDQVNNLNNEYNDWINLRNQNATDDELFDEFDARATETLQVLNETQTKLDATTAKYDVEFALKTQRESDLATQMEQQAFNQRSADREQWFNDLSRDAQTAQTALTSNQTDITNTTNAMSDYLAASTTDDPKTESD